MDNITLSSKSVALSQSTEDSLYVKFIICDFDVNGNGVKLNRSTIDNWLPTLINAPLLGKIEIRDDGSVDFSDHNPYIVTREDDEGNTYNMLAFDTSAFGSFSDAWVENIDGKDYIVANARVWKRFFEAAELIVDRVSNGTLHSSWEISVNNYTMDMSSGMPVKIINDAAFIGHTLLGADVPPAYQCTTVLSLSSKDEDRELASAILNGVFEMNNIEAASAIELEQSNDVVVETIDEVLAEPTVEDTEVSEAPEVPEVPEEPEAEEVEESSGETESETGEVEKLNIRISALNEIIIDLNKRIDEQAAQIANLLPYKEEHDRLEAERIEAERQADIAALRTYVVESGQFEDEEIDGEEMSALISNLERDKINSMIVERLISSRKASFEEEEGETVPKIVETSSADAKPDLQSVSALEKQSAEDKVRELRHYLSF